MVKAPGEPRGTGCLTQRCLNAQVLRPASSMKLPLIQNGRELFSPAHYPSIFVLKETFKAYRCVHLGLLSKYLSPFMTTSPVGKGLVESSLFSA